MEHPREVLTREQILENVWGYDFMGESNVIEVYIRYLRLKIEEEGQKRLIQTIRGVGYVLRDSWHTPNTPLCLAARLREQVSVDFSVTLLWRH